MKNFKHTWVENGRFLVTAKMVNGEWVLWQVRSSRTGRGLSPVTDSTFNNVMNSAEVAAVDWSTVPAATLASFN